MTAILTESVVARAKAKGWPDGLAERALAASTPSLQIDQWLQASADANFLFEVERITAVDRGARR
ncbi:MAG: hypothetical protein ACRED9_12890 [Caulobacteraceae bacterium]